MKWGVRKNIEVSSKTFRKKVDTRTDKERHAERMAIAKKVAIGTGILVAVAGTAYVGYKLHQNGKLPLSFLNKKSKVDPLPTIEKTFHPPTEIIHLARGKHEGLTFL